MKPVVFHPDARADLLEARQFYENQAAGLGARFVDEVDLVVQLIQAHPELGAPYGSPERSTMPLRRWSLHRFPFYLVYTIEDDSIIVLATAHQRRRPGYWRNRKQ